MFHSVPMPPVYHRSETRDVQCRNAPQKLECWLGICTKDKPRTRSDVFARGGFLPLISIRYPNKNSLFWPRFGAISRSQTSGISSRPSPRSGHLEALRMALKDCEAWAVCRFRLANGSACWVAVSAVWSFKSTSCSLKRATDGI